MMLATLSLVALVTTATAGPVVAVLPFEAADGATKKQAKGVTALFRNKVDDADFLTLLKARRDDRRKARKCRRKPACLGKAAFERGADLLVWGEVAKQDTGFSVYLIVLEPKGTEPLRQVIGDVVGQEEDISDRLDRMIREALAPAALAGGLTVTGNPDGALVFLDDKLAGETPLPPTTGIVEGDYVLRVEKDGYYPHTRPIKIRFPEIALIEVTLVPKKKKFASSRVFVDPEAEEPSIPFLGPMIVAGVGGAIVAAATGLGTFSLLDSLEVERRASTQNLLFPRDASLVQRGQLLAFWSSVTWGAAALVLAGAGGWAGYEFIMAPTTSEQEMKNKLKNAPRLDGPAEGAPDKTELSPTVAP